jgi:ribonuclease D
MRQKFEEKKQRYAARQRMTRVKKTTLPKRTSTISEPSEDTAEEFHQPRAMQRKPVRSVKLLSRDPVVVQLHEICAEIAASRGVSVARVLTESTMKTIAKNRPKNFAELSAITGKQKAALLSSRVLRLFKDD